MTTTADRASDHELRLQTELINAIVGMREDEAIQLAQRLIEGGVSAAEILDSSRRAMTVLGQRFESGEVFIPELIMGGEIMRGIARELEPHQGGHGRRRNGAE